MVLPSELKLIKFDKFNKIKQMYKIWRNVLILLEKIGSIFKSLSISQEIITAPKIAKSLDTIKIKSHEGIIPINPKTNIEETINILSANGSR